VSTGSYDKLENGSWRVVVSTGAALLLFNNGFIHPFIKNIVKNNKEKEDYLQGIIAQLNERIKYLEGELAHEKNIIMVHNRYLEAWVKKKNDVNINVNGGSPENKPVSEAKELHHENPVITVIEELFHFIHPSIDSTEEWAIHSEVKRLVTRNGIQEICNYLFQMAKNNKILLPQSPLVAYQELVRMGMPNKDGFNEKTFQKYYMR
jgi:hypothetical protein